MCIRDSFYEQPKNDNAEMDELLERIASLESELESEKGKASAVDDQVALMEKSCLLYTSKGLIEIRLKKPEKEFVVPDNIEDFDIRNYV